MKYLRISYPDIENGLGFRVTLWTSGCTLKCKGCQNPRSHSFQAGQDFTEEAEAELLNALKKPYIKGLTLSGGNPIEVAKDLVPVIKKIKEELPDKDIWLFSGFTLEEILESGDQDKLDLLGFIDYLVDGPFVLDLRDVSIAFRGSTNQKIYKRIDGLKFEEVEDL
jgi:anaerobic ribonucleoside-triphosphate reductase activating protein